MRKKSEEFYLIFEAGDPLQAEVVRAALETAEIDCFVENEGVQNLFSLGSLGGLNPLMGTVKVYVRHEDRARAETLLVELKNTPIQETDGVSSSDLPPESYPVETAKPEAKGFLFLLRQWFLK